MKSTKWCFRQLLLWDALTGALLFHTCFPVVHQFVVARLSDRLIALESMILSVGVILIRSLFNKYGDRLFKFCPLYLLIESVAYISICTAIYSNLIPVKVYFLIEISVVALATQCIMCCTTRMRRLMYDGETREYFDNCQSIAFAIGGIVGGSIALIGLPLKLGWIIIIFNVILTDIFVGIVWYKMKKKK